MVTGIIFASILYIFSLFATFGSKQDKGLGYCTIFFVLQYNNFDQSYNLGTEQTDVLQDVSFLVYNIWVTYYHF